MARAVQGVRDRNERAVLRKLLAAGDTGITRPALAAQLGLSTAAVASLVTGRIGRILQSERIDAGKSGPRPNALRIASDAGCALGLDFGQTYMGAGLFDLHGRDLAEPRYIDTGAGEDAAGALEWMRSQAQDMVTDPASLVGVGISIAAPVFRTSPILRQDMFAMPDWAGRNPAQELREMLGWNCPFEIDNDANLASMAELRRGAARGLSDVIFVKWTWGVGAALIVDGELRRGRGVAGELGHVAIALDADHRADPPPVCMTCHRHCLQSVASMPALLRDAGIPDSERRARLHPAVMELVAAIREERPGPRKALERACRYLGQALGSAITILNPEAVIIGGDLTAESYDLFGPQLLASMRTHSTSPAFHDVSVYAGQRTGHASLLGAATWILEEHLLDYLMRQAQALSD